MDPHIHIHTHTHTDNKHFTLGFSISIPMVSILRESVWSRGVCVCVANQTQIYLQRSNGQIKPRFSHTPRNFIWHRALWLFYCDAVKCGVHFHFHFHDTTPHTITQTHKLWHCGRRFFGSKCKENAPPNDYNDLFGLFHSLHEQDVKEAVCE